MYSNANNLKSEIVWSVSANDSTVSITPGEWVLRANNTVACLEHYENEICTKREVIKITSISDNTLTITRSFAVCIMNDKTKEKGDTAFSFDEWDFLSMYLSKELREGLTDWVGENQTAYETMLENLAVPRTCINNCLTTRQSAIDTAYRTKFWGLAWFWNWSDWDCVISEDTFLDAWREYNFRNLTICPDVLVRFEGAGVPTINVRDKFCNLWTIELKAPYVNSASILECWCSCWKEVCNNPTDWGACCGGAWWKPADTAQWTYWCDWCPWTETSWWYWWDTIWCCWKPPVWLDWWRWASSCSTYYWNWWGGGGWWGWRYWNGWDWWNAWRSYCSNGSNWWNGWNSWLYWTWWKGWLWGTVCEETNMGCSWNWWNWYYWWRWWDWRWEWRAWCWWCWIIEWWRWWDADDIKWDAWCWWNAVTNVYWFHLNARCIYNYCVNAKGWTWWTWWDWYWKNCETWFARGCPWWKGANGWQMVVTYCKMIEEGCFDVSGWEGWLWWRTYACESWYECQKHRAKSWTNWTNWRKVMYCLNEENITNTAIYTFWDTKLYREDPHFTPSAWITRWKTIVVYSTEDFPITPEWWTEVVESTVYNQYKDEPYTLTLAEWTYFFTFFVYDTEENIISTFNKKLTIIWNVQYLIVWWGWGGWSWYRCSSSNSYWWGGGGAGWILCWITCLWWEFDISIWWGGTWWVNKLNGYRWKDTCFWREVAYWWGWGWWFCQVWLDGWSWWGGGARAKWWWTACEWQWNNGATSCYHSWWWWGWKWTAGSTWTCYCWGAWWSWICFRYNPTCSCWCICIGWWWGWGACGWTCGWWSAIYWWGCWWSCGCKWNNANNYWWWWGWGSWGSSAWDITCWWNWYPWVVFVTYCTACWYNVQWWDCCFTCSAYTIRRFNTDWKLCIL